MSLPGTSRASAISAVTLAAGRMPPWPGLAPWETLISIILTCGRVAFLRNRSAACARSRSIQASLTSNFGPGCGLPFGA